MFELIALELIAHELLGAQERSPEREPCFKNIALELIAHDMLKYKPMRKSLPRLKSPNTAYSPTLKVSEDEAKESKVC